MGDVEDMIERGRRFVPDHMWEGVRNYFVNHVEPGSFLTALLCNEGWYDVLSKADHINSQHLQQWGVFLYNYAPTGSFGSREKVEAWLNG